MEKNMRLCRTFTTIIRKALLIAVCLLTMTACGSDAERDNLNDDDYVMISNKILEDCYYSKQSFEFEREQNKAPAKIDVIYSVGSGDHFVTSFVLAQNNATMAETDYKVKVLDTDLYDYNADNTKDVAFIVESAEGKQVFMFDGKSFSNFAILDEDEVAKIGADFTVSSIRAGMDKINEFIGSDTGYKKAYADLARSYISEEGEDFGEISGKKYALIYVDDDDIPEIVIDHPGYYQRIHTYKDGNLTDVIEGAYGTHGCTGFDYSPKKGVFSCFCTIGSGQGCNVSYYSVCDNGEAKEDCYYELSVDGEEKYCEWDEENEAAYVKQCKKNYVVEINS